MPYPTKNSALEAMYRRVIDKYFWGKDTSGTEIAPLALNNENILAVNAAGTGTVSLIKADALNRVTLPAGAVIPGVEQVAVVTVTLAQLKAGATIVAAVTGQTLTPTSFRLKFTGAFTTATTIRLSDTAASPVDIATVAIANATDGNILTSSGGTGLTIGAGFGVPLTLSKGIQLRDVTANTAAGGTSIDVQVRYLIT